MKSNDADFLELVPFYFIKLTTHMVMLHIKYNILVSFILQSNGNIKI
jgi:hypothetical protein